MNMARQILVISGKGGTGKTVVTAAMCALANNAVIVDADVDAANLFLLLDPNNQETHKFSGGYKARVDAKLCLGCGKCRQYCRFGAVDRNFIINENFCEGCGLCARICPQGAIEMVPADSGEWYVAKTDYGTFVHARLNAAEENSGKLVSLIKQQAVKIAASNDCAWIIIDGPPGVGCPVIAALSGADIVLIVTEATLSGLHDAKRVIAVANHFQVQMKLVINKYDLNEFVTKEIEEYCKQNNIPVVGKIKFDEVIIEAVTSGNNIMASSNPKAEPIKQAMLGIWRNLINF